MGEHLPYRTISSTTLNTHSIPYQSRVNIEFTAVRNSIIDAIVFSQLFWRKYVYILLIMCVFEQPLEVFAHDSSRRVANAFDCGWLRAISKHPRRNSIHDDWRGKDCKYEEYMNVRVVSHSFAFDFLLFILNYDDYLRQKHIDRGKQKRLQSKQVVPIDESYDRLCAFYKLRNW